MLIGVDELNEMRALAEAHMPDLCRVSRQTGYSAQDEETGVTAPVLTELFTSRCKVQSQTLEATTPEVGGRQATFVRPQVHLPFGSDAVHVDDVVEILLAGDGSDPLLVGKSYRVRGHERKTFATAVRLDVEEILA